jgi:creatinine amidohydrolase
MPTSLNTTAELARHPTRMAILPIGATEQHSKHLPLATDTIIVGEVARRTAEKLKAYCLPVLPFSISHMHRGTRGTIWLRNQTLVSVIRDIAVSLRHEGFSQLVLLNGHGGNFILVPIVQDLNMDFPDLLTLTLDTSVPIRKSGIFEDMPSMFHADEYETSCILYLYSDAVKRKEFRDQKNEPDRELLRYFPFPKLSSITHTGRPSRATAEKGKRSIECIVEYAVQSIQATLRKVARQKSRR